jgi:hypothetical protein
LFLLDDTKDSDATNTNTKKPILKSESIAFLKASEFIKDGGKIEDIMKKYAMSKEVEQALLAIK